MPYPLGMKKAPKAAMAEVKPVMAADSLSAWRRRSSAEAMGISRSISFAMIAGIIWKVEALPMPVAKNSRMKTAKKPQKAFGSSLMPTK